MKKHVTLVESAISLCTFVGLFYGTFVLYPYIATSQKYEGLKNVSELFPVAIMESGHAGIVKWSEYINNPAAYKEKLIKVPSEEKFALSDHERFTLKSGRNNSLVLSLYEEDYNFFAEYSLENGIVKPLNFRFTGAFVVLNSILVALIGTPVIGWLRRRAIERRKRLVPGVSG